MAVACVISLAAAELSLTMVAVTRCFGLRLAKGDLRIGEPVESSEMTATQGVAVATRAAATRLS